MKSAKEYVDYFASFFNNVREAFIKSVQSREDEALSSGELAHKKAIWSLPCPVHVARLIVNTHKYKEANGGVYHLIAYDLFNAGKADVNYYGEIDIDELVSFDRLQTAFKLDTSHAEELVKFKFQGYADPENWFYVTVIPYDIFDNPLEHAREFRFSFSFMFGHAILDKFQNRIDFNSKYGLSSEPILSVSELLQKDNTFSGFIKMDRDGNVYEITIEDMQNDICHLQLIPHVPKDVLHVFNAAKKLYVLAYFDYYLFTISNHYTFLALESALRNRYQAIHGESRKFIKLPDIINDLVKNKIIPNGEAQLYSSGGYLRNELSHLTKLKKLQPGPGVLERVCYQINFLYEQ